MTHGLASTYRHGCRCEPCRVAHTARLQEERSARACRPADDVPHGLSGYNNWRCRCTTCKAAKAAANARRKPRRKAAVPR